MVSTPARRTHGKERRKARCWPGWVAGNKVSGGWYRVSCIRGQRNSRKGIEYDVAWTGWGRDQRENWRLEKDVTPKCLAAWKEKLEQAKQKKKNDAQGVVAPNSCSCATLANGIRSKTPLAGHVKSARADRVEKRRGEVKDPEAASNVDAVEVNMAQASASAASRPNPVLSTDPGTQDIHF